MSKIILNISVYLFIARCSTYNKDMEPSIIFIGLNNTEESDYDQAHLKDAEQYKIWISNMPSSKIVYISQKNPLCCLFTSVLNQYFKGDLKLLKPPSDSSSSTAFHLYTEFEELESETSLEVPENINQHLGTKYSLIIIVLDESYLQSLNLKLRTRRSQLSSFNEYELSQGPKKFLPIHFIQSYKSLKDDLLSNSQASVEHVFEKLLEANKYLYLIPEIKKINKSLDGNFKKNQESLLKTTNEVLIKSTQVLSKIKHLSNIVNHFSELAHLYVLSEPPSQTCRIKIMKVKFDVKTNEFRLKVSNDTEYDFKSVQLFLCETEVQVGSIQHLQSCSSVSIGINIQEEFFYCNLIAVSGGFSVSETFALLPLKLKLDKNYEGDKVSFNILNLSYKEINEFFVVSPQSIDHLYTFDGSLEPGQSHQFLIDPELNIKSLFIVWDQRQASNFLVLQ